MSDKLTVGSAVSLDNAPPSVKASMRSLEKHRRDMRESERLSQEAAHSILNNFHPHMVDELKAMLNGAAKDQKEREILGDLIIKTVQFLVAESASNKPST